MKLHMVKMRLRGIAIPKKRLLDRFNCGNFGELAICETNDQGLHRLTRVARFTSGSSGQYESTLFDPHILWVEGERMVITGFERVKTEEGMVDYAQSWLCIQGDVPGMVEQRT